MRAPSFGACLALLLMLLPALALRAATGTLKFQGSIGKVLTAAQAGPDARGVPYISRLQLTPAETAQELGVEVALKLRNFDELQARINRGEIVPRAEMEARYLPLASDQTRVAEWFRAQGVTVVNADPSHLAVFIRASVADLSRVFATQFARVTLDNVDYTSAVTAPSLPSSIAGSIAGIRGLQQHQRLRLLSHAAPLRSQAVASYAPPYKPAQILAAYGAANSGLTGEGETIAIMAAAYPDNSDITNFWVTYSIPNSVNNLTTIDVEGGPPASPDKGSLDEAGLDIEWASSIAPAAKIRVYGVDISDLASLDKVFLRVYADLPSNPSLHVLSISFGYGEAEAADDYLVVESQYVAVLASAGVTIFASTGDSGAYADSNRPSQLQVCYPASDPNVTAVGGTTMYLASDGTISSEKAWGGAGTSGSTGGGISGFFPRPSWQVGSGITAGSYRLVPDVAMVGDPQTGATIYVKGAFEMVGGTSWSTPVWAGLCTLINQSRIKTGLGPLGALNPRIYPLIGTSAFRDITTGNNGLYYAAQGYDMCTGLGVPVFSNLLAASLTYNGVPLVSASTGDRFTVRTHGVAFMVAASGQAPLSYQWERQPAGSSTWTPLTDDGVYSGTHAPMLQIGAATAAMNGDHFHCVVGNAAGSATSAPGALTVASTGVCTIAGWAEDGGTADGFRQAARFSYPGGVKIDAAGNLYVSDGRSFTIRKVTPAGVVTTYAGQPGVAGTADGPAATAQFGGPGGVAIDAAGDVFVADTGNYSIRKIAPDRTVSTFAGLSGTSGAVDGTGSAARFADPENLAIDLQGNLFVADGKGNTIRKITPAGVVSTYAGSGAKGSADGPAATATFNLPLGVATDFAGNVYVGDSGNHLVRKITPDGTVSTLAGTAGSYGSTDGTGSAARFFGPSGLAVDSSGNVYVADAINCEIRKIAPDGSVTTVAGAPIVPEATDGQPANARFYLPADVAIDASGNVVVADGDNNLLRLIVLNDPDSPVITAQPAGATITAGGSFSLTMSASGPTAVGYQWYKDGSILPGATGPIYPIPTVSSEYEGVYTCVATNAAGSVTSAPAPLVVDPLTAFNANARLTSISSRTLVEAGTNAQVAGFIIGGSAPKTVLIRASGPSLAQFGINNVLADPKMELVNVDTGAVVATNDNWGDDPSKVTAFLDAFKQTGAFQWDKASKDSALLLTLPPGAYTATVTDVNGGSGVALVEVYDVDRTGPRMLDISTRSVVGTGQQVQVGGFAINGTGLKTVLVRATGPGLAQFGVPGTVNNPVLKLYNQATGYVITTNDDWGSNPYKAAQIKAAARKSGAFALKDGSTDAVLLVTLPPGLYTAETTDKDGNPGVGLIEIYEIE